MNWHRAYRYEAERAAQRRAVGLACGIGLVLLGWLAVNL